MLFAEMGFGCPNLNEVSLTPLFGSPAGCQLSGISSAFAGTSRSLPLPRHIICNIAKGTFIPVEIVLVDFLAGIILYCCLMPRIQCSLVLPA